MGWWSATIMGGDPPLDAEIDIIELAGISSDDEHGWDHDQAAARRCLETVTVAQWETFLTQGNDADYTRVKAQVVALMHMQVGATLPTALAEAAVRACEEEDCDTWNEPAERRHHLQLFSAMVGVYDGTPVSPPEEGLFEKIATMPQPSRSFSP